MGTCSSKSGDSYDRKSDSYKGFKAISDQYKTFDDLKDGLRREGLEASQLIIGVDMSQSNESTGRHSYGRSLHDISVETPYEAFIKVVGPILSTFDDDNMIPLYRFGDAETTDKKVMPFDFGGKLECHGWEEVLKVYRENVRKCTMSGPTTMAPMIREAVEMIKESREYHILLILTDGGISNPKLDAQAVVEASKYPLSIIAVGIGDGPFDILEEFDDKLPSRKFDNFQFTNFTELQRRFAREECPDLLVACSVLQEIPMQYKFIKQLGYLN
eukprot:gnl/Chilomastix_caulleri/1099.p1 GENE.gnl/Chilomastix_caulleri/1099~~gnl/Chilomastix_caulleri/1099.p1  ORF type:complete len:272 (+),score=81.21 gnl/Chilomastix_caulleri/1099:30-845(+)